MILKSPSYKPVRAFFPFLVLRPGPTLIDPSNTESTYEYYLLENLSLGLIRDATNDPTGYEPALAETWRQISPSEWEFQLKHGLKWSDGSPIRCADWENHFKRLKESGSRHLQYLKNIERVACDSSRDLLRLSFSHPTPGMLLHELSLADSGLLHPSNLLSGWKVTCGAYTVAQYDPDQKLLQLSPNQHFALQHETAVAPIELVNADLSKDPQWFKSDSIDLVSVAAYTFRSIIQNAAKRAPVVTSGHPNVIHFFIFNKDHPAAARATQRLAFKSLLEDFSKGHPAPAENLKYQSQMIPSGYSGWLPHWRPNLSMGSSEEKLASGPLKVTLPTPWKELKPYFDSLQLFASSRGVKLDFRFENPPPTHPFEKDDFAQLRVFKGNQKDPLGSWSFLVEGEQAPLRLFGQELKPFLNAAVNAPSETVRTESLAALHRDVLEKGYAIPFLVEAPPVLTSSRISLRRWNQFDMRLRFYDLEIR